MVRKSTRSLKAAEKAKLETPRRGTRASTRRRRGTPSEESDDDYKKQLNQSPDRSEKDSSDSDSPDRDSKKPFKKRIRGRNRESPVVKVDDNEEVKEGRKGKGKSKSKNKSNDTDNVEIENDNTQVTIESPSIIKEEQKDESHSDQKTSETITTGENNNGDTDNGTNDQQCTEEANEKEEQKHKDQDNGSNLPLMSNQIESNDPREESNDPRDELFNEANSKTEESKNSDTEENNHTEQNKYHEIVNPTTVEKLEESSKEEPISTEDNSKDIKQTEEPKKKITLKRISEIKEPIQEEQKLQSDSNSEENKDITDVCHGTINLNTPEIKKLEESSKQEPISIEANNQSIKTIEKKDEPRKKISLKRISEIKTVQEELKLQSENNKEVYQEHQKDSWSSYESNRKSSKDDKDSKSDIYDDKNVRKKISLKRRTTDEKKEDQNDTRTEINLVRRSSVQEQSPKKQKVHSETETSSPINIKKITNEPLQKECEEKSRVKKPMKRIILIRNLVEEDSSYQVLKSKWGKSDITDVENIKLAILKDICPNIELLSESEVNLEIVLKERKGSEKERQKSFNEMEAEEMEKIEAELNAEPEDFEEKENIIAMNRKISIVEDTASKLKPPPSPAKNAVSDVLYITNLVRPFTVKQLKELLERTGKIQDDGFWTDRIKSKCYVHYETTEEAEATRNALHGVHWPIGNGKQLIIEFATVEDLENAKHPPVVRKEKTPDQENMKTEKEDTATERNGDRTGRDREWDGKDANLSKNSRSRSRDRQRKHIRRSYTPDDYHNKRKKREDPVPQKAMDDLFLKTKATPSIYWQPLSPEEIALKQQQRQARLEENKRRMEEMRSSGRRDPTRERDRRDRNFRRR